MLKDMIKYNEKKIVKTCLCIVFFMVMSLLLVSSVFAFKDFYFSDVENEPEITQIDIDKYLKALTLAHVYEDDDVAMEEYLNIFDLSYQRFMFIAGKIPLIFQEAEGRGPINKKYANSMIPTANEIKIINVNRENILNTQNKYKANSPKHNYDLKN